METGLIDGLLERYLTLLDEYTRLRSTLNDLQSRMYQDIARANFSGERGVRYGQDFYDDRMRALKRLQITAIDGQTPMFKIQELPPQLPESQPAEENESDQAEKPSQKPKDPLRWFGILTPLPLRSVQSQAKKAVDEIIPQLVSVNTEMAELELQVRRARKKRAKAESLAKKGEQDGSLKQDGIAA
ncbi:hypothetical protein NKR23_g10159 [Pleurostoma richardsiae]|uniref:Vacuolar ATPase assembly protein VMA22 n=1 Tax=Pleurostoma richardsiae TaxID=41990 RepID=A0AA38R3F6_9PEZI|nr:hypothetical protein NKR23_g10159 [Pleurostoma richardsiae]